MFHSTFLMVIGLHPSTADEYQDDPTVRRCIDFSKRWGYGALCMMHIFGYRSTNPDALTTIADPIGALTDTFLLAHAQEAPLLLAAWGTYGRQAHLGMRGDVVATMLHDHPLVCLGTHADGSPTHPLSVAKATVPQPTHLPVAAALPRLP